MKSDVAAVITNLKSVGMHTTLNNESDDAVAETPRSDPNLTVLGTGLLMNDAEPAPQPSLGNVKTVPVENSNVDAAENLRSSTIACKPAGQTNDAEPAPAFSELDGANALSTKGSVVVATENLRSIAKPPSTHFAQRGSRRDIMTGTVNTCRCSAGRCPQKSLIDLSLESAATIQLALEAELLREETRISRAHKIGGYERMQRCKDVYTIDQVACSTLSSIIRTQRLSIEDSVRFVRGETDQDTRPNKALDATRLAKVLRGYPHLAALTKIATHGVEAEWSCTPPARRPPPKNHGSCRRHSRAVTKSIREGQDCGQYTVVEADILSSWPSVICSPLGAVEKKVVDPSTEVRTIHDLSYPEGESTNSSFKTESVPTINYEPITKIARRIEYLAKQGDPTCIRILKGDVRGAYRHLRTIAWQVFRMASFIKELNILVIDLAAPFGWAGSPPFYGLFGRAISWFMSTNSPASVSTSDDNEPFFGYEWVDDHILVELDVGDRLHRAESTLRHAMVAVLGPRSINEAKFSGWCTELVALGLLWNTTDQTVSIPADKIAKALQRVSAMLSRRSATKTELQKLLGSLRHVGTCVRTSKPFYQQLHALTARPPRFARIQLSEGALRDLLWFQNILAHGHLAALPVSMFGNLPAPNVELYMDSSNRGLAVLDPAVDKFIQLKFDSEEEILMDTRTSSDKQFSINVREHLCMDLGLWTWGPTWYESSGGSMVHVKCWSDNISAVQWCNRLHSNNELSQEINRAIGLAEVYFNLRVSADHLPGSTNWMADAASRAWTEPFKTR